MYILIPFSDFQISVLMSEVGVAITEFFWCHKKTISTTELRYDIRNQKRNSAGKTIILNTCEATTVPLPTPSNKIKKNEITVADTIINVR